MSDDAAFYASDAAEELKMIIESFPPQEAASILMVGLIRCAIRDGGTMESLRGWIDRVLNQPTAEELFIFARLNGGLPPWGKTLSQ